MAFGLDHVIVTDVDPSSPERRAVLSGQALVRGKTVLVAEAGRSGIVGAADLASLVEGSLNVLGALGMLDAQGTAGRRTWLAAPVTRIARRQRRRVLPGGCARHSGDERTSPRPYHRLPRPPHRRDPRADRRARDVHPRRPVDGSSGNAGQHCPSAARLRKLESAEVDGAIASARLRPNERSCACRTESPTAWFPFLARRLCRPPRRANRL